MKEILLSIALLLFLLLGGCGLLRKTIYDSMDCNQFNIDHIEMRTGINIPLIDSTIHCSLDAHFRDVSFRLSEKVDMNRYANSHFVWSDDNGWRSEGKAEGHRWKAELDTITRQLAFTIQYNE
jgi:uncharacterized protein YceK